MTLAKRLFGIITILLALSTQAFASGPLLSSITGVVYNADGSTCNFCTITFAFATPGTPQIVNGNTIQPFPPVYTTTDGSGNLVAISLAQGVALIVTIQNGQHSVSAPIQVVVPYTSGVTFAQLLANNGILPSGTTSVSSLSTGTKAISTSPYTVSATDFFIDCNASSGAITINLSASSGAGRWLNVKKTDSSSNACTITPNGSDTIDGSSSYTLTIQNASVYLNDTEAGAWKLGGKSVQLGNATAGTFTATTISAGNLTSTSQNTGHNAVSTTPYTVASTDLFIDCNAASGSIVLNLPASSGAGRWLNFKKTDSSTNTCTVTPAGTDSIDGASSYVLSVQYASIYLHDTESGKWQVGGKSVQLGNTTATSITSSGTGPYSINGFSKDTTLNILAYGAIADAVNCPLGGAGVSGTTLTVTAANCASNAPYLQGFVGFTANDCQTGGTGCTGPTNKTITISGAGSAGAPYIGTIVGYTSSTVVTLSGSPNSVSNKPFTYGTINTTAIQAAQTACENLSLANKPAAVYAPAGNYLTYPFQVGNPATEISLPSNNSEPGCPVFHGDGPLATMFYCLPASNSYTSTTPCIQRNQQQFIKVTDLGAQSALADGTIADDMLNLIDFGWQPVSLAPDNQPASYTNLFAGNFNGTGINLAFTNQALTNHLYSASDWASGTSVPSQTITQCTEDSSVSACLSGATVTCTVSSDPFVVGEYVDITGNSLNGYTSYANGAQLVRVAGAGSFKICATTASLGTGTGGTAKLTPISYYFEENGGPFNIYDIQSGNGSEPSLTILEGQNWTIGGASVFAGGLQIGFQDYNAAHIDDAQFLGPNPNTGVAINAASACNANSAASLTMLNDYVTLTGSSQYTFNGQWYGGVNIFGGRYGGSSSPNGFAFINQTGCSNNGSKPTFKWDGSQFSGLSIGQTNVNAFIKITNSYGTGTFFGVSEGTPTNLEMESIFSSAGLPLPTCTNGMWGSPWRRVSDMTAACAVGTAYVGSGSHTCVVMCPYGGGSWVGASTVY